jgi:hypothetical protein
VGSSHAAGGDRPASGQELPDAPVSKATWTMFTGLGAKILADGVNDASPLSTTLRRTRSRCQAVRSCRSAGADWNESAGSGAMGGVWFVLHRTHHQPTAKWFLRSVTDRRGLQRCPPDRRSSGEPGKSGCGWVKPQIPKRKSASSIQVKRAVWRSGGRLPAILEAIVSSHLRM